MRLRTFHWLVAAGLSLLVAAACSSPPPAQTDLFRTTPTIKDIMDSMVDPSADYLWESVATIVTKAGIEERMPRTDEDWKKVRRAAVTLFEAANNLMMQGRIVAKSHEKSENPGIELEPEEIQKIIDGDRATYIKFAHSLQDAAMMALVAIDAKDAKGLSDSGETIDMACENCHLKYWYPNSPPPPGPDPRDSKPKS